VSVLVFLVTAVIVPILVGEFTDWLPWFAERMIAAAARTMPSAVRSRYVEEWLAELEDVPGKLSKLVFAARVLVRAPVAAAAIRGVPANGTGNASADLVKALSDLALYPATTSGLRIDYAFDSVPSLPVPVVVALQAAATEALRNVAHNAEVNEARIHAIGDGRGGVSVTVADHGRGFDLNIVPLNLGLTRSIQERIIEAGGKSAIKSAPGRGTVVELSWSPAGLTRQRGSARLSSSS